jgi:hypothetical protein
VPVLQLGLRDVFIEHGDPVKLLAMQGAGRRRYRSFDRSTVLRSRTCVELKAVA